MNNKKPNRRPPTNEELKEMFKGIIQENRDYGHIPPRVIKSQCNQCKEKAPRKQEKNPHIMTCKIYPNGMPRELLLNELPCEEFKQK